MREYIEILEASNRPKTLEVAALPYEIDALSPVISRENLEDHHDVLYKNYVKRFNEHEGDRDFNRAGAFLHERFFSQLQRPNTANRPRGAVSDLIEDKFKTFDDFKIKFTEEAMAIQGSGWCYLSTSGDIKTIKNHAVRVDIAMLLDMWEHSYYLDYGPNKEKYIDSFWRIVNWEIVNQRL